MLSILIIVTLVTLFMVKCARCDHDVDDVRNISPDMVSRELIDSVDHGEEDMGREDSTEVRAECINGLTGE